MQMDAQSRGTDRDLIEGGVGPFYVALNRATFFLVAAIFFAAAPVVAFVLRDAPLALRIAVLAGIALESGAVAHIACERVFHAPARIGWAAHVAVSALVAAALFAVMFA
jgi:hypothetical protein